LGVFYQWLTTFDVGFIVSSYQAWSFDISTLLLPKISGHKHKQKINYNGVQGICNDQVLTFTQYLNWSKLQEHEQEVWLENL